MDYRSLRYDVRDGVALITLAREKQLNALNSDMNRELPLVWRRFETDRTARVAVITGRPKRTPSNPPAGKSYIKRRLRPSSIGG